MATKRKSKTKDAKQPIRCECGKPALARVGAQDVSAEALCLPHWVQKHGLAEVKGAVIFA